MVVAVAAVDVINNNPSALQAPAQPTAIGARLRRRLAPAASLVAAHVRRAAARHRQAAWPMVRHAVQAVAAVKVLDLRS